MVAIPGQGLIDFSFICSLRCNLKCPFCMYDAGPNVVGRLQTETAKQFIDTIDWGKVNSIGFYGGEISYEYKSYEDVINLIPKNIQKFCITNGSWSRDALQAFYSFILKHNLITFVSTTPNHRARQDKRVLDNLIKASDLISYKSDDVADGLLPMGRNYKEDWECSRKCQRYKGPVRMAMMPDGNIIFQSCDGIYPVIGDYRDRFDDLLEREIVCLLKGDGNEER